MFAGMQPRHAPLPPGSGQGRGNFFVGYEVNLRNPRFTSYRFFVRPPTAAAAPIRACSPDPLAIRRGAQPGAAALPPREAIFSYGIFSAGGGPAHFPLLALRSPLCLPRLPFRQSPSWSSRYVRRDAAKARPAAPRVWTGAREFLHQPPLAPSHAVDRFRGRRVSQRSPRGGACARSAGKMCYGGGSSCLTGRSPAIAELVSRNVLLPLHGHSTGGRQIPHKPLSRRPGAGLPRHLSTQSHCTSGPRCLWDLLHPSCPPILGLWGSWSMALILAEMLCCRLLVEQVPK